MCSADEPYGNVNKSIDPRSSMYNAANHNHLDVLLGAIWHDLCGVLNKPRVRGCLSSGVTAYRKNQCTASNQREQILYHLFVVWSFLAHMLKLNIGDRKSVV